MLVELRPVHLELNPVRKRVLGKYLSSPGGATAAKCILRTPCSRRRPTKPSRARPPSRSKLDNISSVSEVQSVLATVRRLVSYSGGQEIVRELCLINSCIPKTHVDSHGFEVTLELPSIRQSRQRFSNFKGRETGICDSRKSVYDGNLIVRGKIESQHHDYG